MPKFSYIALDSRGTEKSGLLDAQDVRQVAALLRQQGLFPTNVGITQSNKEAKKTPLLSGSFVFKMPFLRPVRTRELTGFTRQLGTLLHAGMPLLRGLE